MRPDQDWHHELGLVDPDSTGQTAGFITKMFPFVYRWVVYVNGNIWDFGVTCGLARAIREARLSAGLAGLT
jgi:hypothetical protein